MALALSAFSSLLLVAPLACAGGDESRLDRGLAAIDARAMQADLAFLSSDELGGRGSPSPEQRIAARFLRQRVERLGFEPAGDDGYIDRYELDYAALVEAKTFLDVTGPHGAARFVPRADWFFPAPTTTTDRELPGRLVWVGRGSTGDLEGVDLGGAWALVSLDVRALVGKPGAAVDFRLRPVADLCERRGALGTLFLPDDSADFAQLEEVLERATLSAFGGRLSELGGKGRRQPEPGPSRIVLRPHAARELLVACTGSPAPPSAVGTELSGRLVDSRRAWRDEAGGFRAELENVCALWPGSHPDRSREVIVVSAHYDHLGRQGDLVWNGADDNGTGTTVLLALAEALAAHGALDRSVMLIWVSAEEHGLLGSKAWCADPTLPEGYQPIANLNIDMVGRNAPDELHLTPTRSMGKLWNGLAEALTDMAPLEGFEKIRSADSYYHRSDQKSFQDAFDIPVAFLFADVHEDYHQPGDDVEKVDFDKLERVARLSLRALLGLQGEDPGL